MATFTLQDLLNMEVEQSNSGNRDNANHIRYVIRQLRPVDPPVCFGDDDCSTSLLSRCPYSFDCGV